MKKIYAITVLIFASFLVQAQNSLVRFPAIDPTGENLAFSYQGDIWVMNLKQNIPIRLTIHEAYDKNPMWSPDGKQIAFNSDRFGSDDVFVMNSDGSGLKRLTFHPGQDLLNSWTIPQRIVFETRRYNAQAERDNEIFYISPEGGNAVRLLEALGSFATESPDGKNVAFVRGTCPINRQAYEGSANRDIWLFNKQDKTYQQITSRLFNQFQPIWLSPTEMLYISSNGTKIYQLISLTINGNQTLIQDKSLTNFTDFGIRYFSVASKSLDIVVEQGDKILLKKAGENNFSPINISIPVEDRAQDIQHQSFTSEIDNFQLSPNGKYLVLPIHGNLFISQAKDANSITRRLTNNTNNNQNPVWLNDSVVLFTSVTDGQSDIFSIESDDNTQGDLFKSLKHKTTNLTNSQEDEHSLVMSNKKDKIVYQQDRGKMLIAEIDNKGKMTNSKVLLDGWANPSNVSFSPDDQYLAYALSDLDFNREIFIHPADNSFAPVNISMHPRTDTDPVWSPDGKKLAFSSLRNYGSYDIWFVWLQKKDAEKSAEDWELEEFEKENGESDKKSDKAKPAKVIIDFDDIHNRLVQLTSIPGNESRPCFSENSQFIYFNGNIDDINKSDIFKIKWNKKELTEVTKDGKGGYDLMLSNDGKFIYLLQNEGKMSRIKLAADKIESISVKAEMDINLAEQKEKVFEEAWKTMADGFYDPEFHGNDWNDLGKKYKPLVLKSSCNQDFSGLFNWLLGELNASHMGFNGPKEKSKSREKCGLIGIDFENDKNGIKVLRVLKGSPADYDQSRLLPNDIIVNVDGQPLSSESNFYSFFINKTDEPVVLEIERNNVKMEVVIRPTSSLSDVLYNNWVLDNRKMVDEYALGKLGYLHIQSMGWESFEQFERDLMAAGYGKKGILIDVRNNGGGWTADYLMAVIAVKQHAYTIPRGAAENLEKEHKNFRSHYAFGERLPFASWTKPSIALCNQNSYSNAEIFSHAYQNNEIGTLVGTPTFGAVISTSSGTLMDGSTIRLPYRGWYSIKTDKNMEHFPAVPDEIVELKPDSRSKGKDEQLQKAVEILLQQIEAKE